MHALYATRIVAVCTKHVETSLALSKDVLPRFCLAITYIFCDWLSVITSIAFYNKTEMHMSMYQAMMLKAFFSQAFILRQYIIIADLIFVTWWSFHFISFISFL